jgi:hypothetical protein
MNIGHFLAAAARSFPERPAISIGAELYADYARFFGSRDTPRRRLSRAAGHQAWRPDGHGDEELPSVF